MKVVNRFATLVALIALLMCLLSGISLWTSLIRSGIVFVGVLFAFFIAGQLFQVGMMATREKVKD
ncbi:MAG TPA: hypothetical protein DHU63_08560 [Candidatus Marinimicrobia bacterium]|nr:MAG: hypothetical protein AUJ47_05550 [Candidatus Marinimicrobia bacterium CG1_02_48_14]PIZ67275.1 MAG: hypothetical protein COY19_05635 [Candidatus Marinimicrobia bacterium CG_4_10_14_0_2_um_filter_48_9]PJA54966.1 MAG: hypothetical protein CO167_00850 [Candidatus Marinimicrobia bacterium CG_4_9_14_3_um_filter_48_9]HCW76576.1 hypothetical protein [Candidatus Neomarinimicrobiota bacterium]